MERMKSYPKNIEDLLQSDLRKKIFKEITLQSGRFSIMDLSVVLNEKGIKVSRNTLQQFLQSLLIRGFLRTYNQRDTQGRGRSRLCLEIAHGKLQEK